MKFDIKKADKAEVLKRLYDGALNFGASHQPLAAILQAHLPPLPIETARQMVNQPKHRLYFDYVNGKALKVDLGEDILDARLYDINCAQGAAAFALEGLEGVTVYEDPQPLELFPKE